MTDSSRPSKFETTPPPPNEEALRAVWAEEQRLLLMTALDTIADAVFATQVNGRITFMNRAAEEMFDITKERVRNEKIFLFDFVTDLRDEPSGQLLIDAVLHDPMNGISREHMRIRSESQVTDVLVSAGGVIIRAELARVLCTCTDITREVNHQRELVHLANTDPLTGIYNRRWFHHYLEKVMRKATTESVSVGLAFVDLDKFKLYNDAAGFEAGDELIKRIVYLMSSTKPAHFEIARVGGDEFLLLSDKTSLEEMMQAASDINLRLLDEKPIRLPNGGSYQIGASFGVSFLTSKSPEFPHIFTFAENAKSSAKAQGRGCVFTLP
jgi:diguanylate cyclase (GGDEF)-like protein/PAS domain S-box-containing protein